MKRTGPTKESTRKLIVALEKHGKETKERIWLAAAEKLAKPRRKAAKLNLWKLARLSSKFKNKTILVAGKVLGGGTIDVKATVAAFDFSEKAKEKIIKAGGEAISLYTLMERKPKASSLVIAG